MTDNRSVERAFIDHLARVATAIGAQANVGAMELAGQIVSILHANPEYIDRFMREGTELMVDGTLAHVETGSLTYHSMKGEVLSPRQLRERKGVLMQ